MIDETRPPLRLSDAVTGLHEVPGPYVGGQQVSVPHSHNTPSPGGGGTTTTTQPGNLQPGQIIQQYPDGTAMIFTGQYNAFGEPVYDFIDISPPSGGGSAIAPTIYGSPYVSTFAGQSVLVQDTNYGPQVIQVLGAPEQGQYFSPNVPQGFVPIYDASGNVVQIQPDPTFQQPQQTFGQNTVDLGSGLLGLTNSQGQIISIINNPSYQGPGFGGLEQLAPGIYGTVNPGGGYGQIVQDPNFQPTFGAPESVGSGLLGIPGEGGYTQFIQDPTYQPTYSGIGQSGTPGQLEIKNAAGEVVGYQQDPAYFNISAQDQLAQFDKNLQFQYDQLKQQESNLKAQLASAEQQNRDRIAGQLQQVQMQIASAERIAAMDDATRRAIANQQAAVTQRGQDIEGQLTARGQNIGLLGNLISARQSAASTAAATRDPFRSSIILGGRSGGTTPVENFYRNYYDFLNSIPTPEVGEFQLPDQVHATAARGLKFNRSNGQPFNILVNDAVMNGDEEIIKTIRTPQGLMLQEIIPHNQTGRVPVHARAAAGFDATNPASSQASRQVELGAQPGGTGNTININVGTPTTTAEAQTTTGGQQAPQIVTASGGRQVNAETGGAALGGGTVSPATAWTPGQRLEMSRLGIDQTSPNALVQLRETQAQAQRGEQTGVDEIIPTNQANVQQTPPRPPGVPPEAVYNPSTGNWEWNGFQWTPEGEVIRPFVPSPEPEAGGGDPPGGTAPTVPPPFTPTIAAWYKHGEWAWYWTGSQWHPEPVHSPGGPYLGPPPENIQQPPPPPPPEDTEGFTDAQTGAFQTIAGLWQAMFVEGGGSPQQFIQEVQGLLYLFEDKPSVLSALNQMIALIQNGDMPGAAQLFNQIAGSFGQGTPPGGEGGETPTSTAFPPPAPPGTPEGTLIQYNGQHFRWTGDRWIATVVNTPGPTGPIGEVVPTPNISEAGAESFDQWFGREHASNALRARVLPDGTLVVEKRTGWKTGSSGIRSPIWEKVSAEEMQGYLDEYNAQTQGNNLVVDPETGQPTVEPKDGGTEEEGGDGGGEEGGTGSGDDETDEHFKNAGFGDDPEATVKQELESALAGDKTVVPTDLEPVYGVTLPAPTELAPLWNSWSQVQRDIVVSAYDLRGIPPEVLWEEFILPFIPNATPPTVIGYG